MATDISRPVQAADADVIEGWVRSKLPRIVALLGPVIAATVAGATFWLQDVIGIDLQRYNGAAAAFIGLVLLGALSFGVTWLFNAGKGQVEIAARLTDALVQEGKRVNDPVPTPDAGMKR